MQQRARRAHRGNRKPQNPAQQPDPCTAIIAQFPASGQGYYTYDNANQRYGQGEVVSSLVNFASNWNQNHPNNPIGVGDISLRGAGIFRATMSTNSAYR